MNGDGLNDVVVLHDGWDNVGVYLQTIKGALASETLFPFKSGASGSRNREIAVGDFNGDGRPDIVGPAWPNPGLLLLLSQ